MNVRKIGNVLKKKTCRRNPEISTRNELLKIGVCQIVDGIIAILSNGRYVGSFSSDAIEESILAGIKRRRIRRNVNA